MGLCCDTGQPARWQSSGLLGPPPAPSTPSRQLLRADPRCGASPTYFSPPTLGPWLSGGHSMLTAALPTVALVVLQALCSSLGHIPLQGVRLLPHCYSWPPSPMRICMELSGVEPTPSRLTWNENACRCLPVLGVGQASQYSFAALPPTTAAHHHQLPPCCDTWSKKGQSATSTATLV